jgi:hypothetical protein
VAKDELVGEKEECIRAPSSLTDPHQDKKSPGTTSKLTFLKINAPLLHQPHRKRRPLPPGNQVQEEDPGGGDAEGADGEGDDGWSPSSQTPNQRPNRRRFMNRCKERL